MEGPHIQEVEDLKHLHLKQGSVVQFPSNVNLSKDDYFHPPEDPLKESLPLAQVPHPDHCLPSAARQQQTYITHPPHGPPKLLVRGLAQSPPGSPGHTRSRSPGQWPPGPQQLPRKHYHAEGEQVSDVAATLTRREQEDRRRSCGRRRERGITEASRSCLAQQARATHGTRQPPATRSAVPSPASLLSGASSLGHRRSAAWSE